MAIRMVWDGFFSPVRREAELRKKKTALEVWKRRWMSNWKRDWEDWEDLPSGELTFCYGKSPFFMGKSTISMAMFHCYVSSPEGSEKKTFRILNYC